MITAEQAKINAIQSMHEQINKFIVMSEVGISAACKNGAGFLILEEPLTCATLRKQCFDIIKNHFQHIGYKVKLLQRNDKTWVYKFDWIDLND